MSVMPVNKKESRNLQEEAVTQKPRQYILHILTYVKAASK